nr:MAG TPA_asm: hypothetical protein [Caudoviricetes sp.]
MSFITLLLQTGTILCAQNRNIHCNQHNVHCNE